MESWDTHLFDAHPDTEFKDTTIEAEDGSGKDISVKDTGRFVDSFLNSGESMTLDDPMNLSISIDSFSDDSFSITVTRSGNVVLPSLVKTIDMPSGMGSPRDKQNVLFLMVRSQNYALISEDEKYFQYDPEYEVDMGLIASEYFEAKHALNQYFYDSSYGKVGLEGTIIDWMDYPEELTATQFVEHKDTIISFVDQ